MTESAGSEFELIRRFFSEVGPARRDVLRGVGDDCALLEVPEGDCLAVSIDTLVSGVHFYPDCEPSAIGHKALAVGLSDLAAMGATPAWATLALTIPRRDDDWLAAFTRGFDELARTYGVRLVGGDTTRGPLSVTVQAHGLIRPGAAVRRDGARPGDLVWISGTLGDAALALRLIEEGSDVEPILRARLERPTPRVALGAALRGLATAMIDLSDGLVGDLGHILRDSGVGAELELAALPLSPAVSARVSNQGDWSLPLSGGDDYELCFCTASGHAGLIIAMAEGLACPVTRIGRIRGGAGLLLIGPNGEAVTPATAGYDHFGSAV